MGEIVLGAKLLSAGTGLTNAMQSWQGDGLAAGTTETPRLASSWSWMAWPQVQPHSTVPWWAARTAARRAAMPRSRVGTLQALLPAPDGSCPTFS